MKTKTLKKFKDRKEGIVREVGEEFEVTKERFQEINGTKHGVLVVEIKPKKK